MYHKMYSTIIKIKFVIFFRRISNLQLFISFEINFSFQKCSALLKAEFLSSFVNHFEF